MATWAARSRPRRWRARDGVVLVVEGVRFLARRAPEGGFALRGPGAAYAGTYDSLDECEARALDLVRARGLA